MPEGKWRLLLKSSYSADACHTSSLNSCLCPIGSLDGELITTVEGLGNGSAGFSKVQGEFPTVFLTLQARRKARRKGLLKIYNLYENMLQFGLCCLQQLADFSAHG